MSKKYIVNSKTHGKREIILDNDIFQKIAENHIKVWINYAPNIKGFYAIFWDKTKRVRLHRWITDCPKGKVVDHINHNTLDNRRENLRITDHFGNMQNRQDNKVGCTGVYYNKRDNVYVARYKRQWLGQSKSLQEAINLRIAKEQAEKRKDKF